MIEYNMPFDEYAALEGLNASLLKQGAKSMLQARHYATSGTADSTAMMLGRAAHCASLEPDRYMQEYVVYEGARRGKAWDEFKVEHDGKEIITATESEQVDGMVDSIIANRDASRIIDSTAHEMVIQWEDKVLGKCKARLDCYGKETGLVADVKTTGDVTERIFNKTVNRMGTHIQFGWIRKGLKALDLPANQFFAIAVEQKPPHDCVVFNMENWVKAGEEQATLIAQQYRIAQAQGRFPGVSDEVVTLELPSWMDEKPEIDWSE